MTVTIPSKDFGDTKVKRGGEYKRTVEGDHEDYIKKELGIDG